MNCCLCFWEADYFGADSSSSSAVGDHSGGGLVGGGRVHTHGVDRVVHHLGRGEVLKTVRETNSEGSRRSSSTGGIF